MNINTMGTALNVQGIRGFGHRMIGHKSERNPDPLLVSSLDAAQAAS